MKHANISIFVPHIGCPHMCSFCNQHTISGTQKAPTGDEVREICKKALGEVKSPENTEIAFFGGSFTAIPQDYMLELLESACEFVGEDKFYGIRISTRPDCITAEILDILKKYGVTAIELGAQSMSNDVLKANERGHTAEDVYRASDLIRLYGFELGLQMMVGLYKSTIHDEYRTFSAIKDIHPDTVRIYPVVILKNTRLGELYQSGEYKPFDFETVLGMSSASLERFEKLGIRVIKCGLHASEFVEKDMLGGFYHPAFRELCENEIYRRKMECKINGDKKSFVFAVEPSCISKAVGQRKSNVEYFRNNGINIRIIGDENVAKYEVELR
ncbi:MAG: radical SAM protein [Ruminococcus flavefaciens]|nr:radical SAM protein [Ruminococcus flavefaciens]MCM1230562.1 radical SAM protein [Ruminococcus flavefaciens]